MLPPPPRHVATTAPAWPRRDAHDEVGGWCSTRGRCLLTGALVNCPKSARMTCCEGWRGC